MVLDPQAPRGAQMATLPARVRWKADNYNHLLEQPVLFYATALSLALLGDHSVASLWLAWAYVGPARRAQPVAGHDQRDHGALRPVLRVLAGAVCARVRAAIQVF
jgi:hypothetical protein